MAMTPVRPHGVAGESTAHFDTDAHAFVIAEHVLLFIPDAASLLLCSLSCRHWQQDFFHETVLRRWFNSRLPGATNLPVYWPSHPSLCSLQRRAALQRLGVAPLPCKRVKAAGFSRRVCCVGGVVVVGSTSGGLMVYDPYHSYQSDMGRNHCVGGLRSPGGQPLKLKGDICILTATGDQSVLVGSDGGGVAAWDLGGARLEMTTCMQKFAQPREQFHTYYGSDDSGDEAQQEAWVMPEPGDAATQPKAGDGRCTGSCSVRLRDGREAVISSFCKWGSKDSSIMVWEPAPKADDPRWREHMDAARDRVRAQAGTDPDDDELNMRYFTLCMEASTSGELHAATVLGSLQMTEQELLACTAINGEVFAVASKSGLVSLMKCELVGGAAVLSKVAELQMSTFKDGDSFGLGILLAAEGHLLAAASWSSSIVDVWNVSNPARPFKVRSIDQEAVRSVSILKLCDGLVIGGDEPGQAFIGDPYTGTVQQMKLASGDAESCLTGLCVSAKHLVACFNTDYGSDTDYGFGTVVHFYDLGTCAANDRSRAMAAARRDKASERHKKDMQDWHGEQYEEDEEDEEMDDSMSDIDNDRFKDMSVVPIEGAEYNDVALVTKRLSSGLNLVIGSEVWDQSSSTQLSALGLPYPGRIASVAGHDLLLCSTGGLLQLRSLPDGANLAEITLPGLCDITSWQKETVETLSASIHQPQALAITQQKVFLVTISFESTTPTLHARLCIDLCCPEQHEEFAKRFPSDKECSYRGRFGPAVLLGNDSTPVAVLASCDDQATIYFVKLSSQCTVDRAIVMHKRRPTGFVGETASVVDMKLWTPDPCDRSQDKLVSVGSDGKLCIASIHDADSPEASWRVTKTNTTPCSGLAICNSLHMAFTVSNSENRGMWWDLSSQQPVWKQEPLGGECRPGKFTVFCCEFTNDGTGTVVLNNSNDCEDPTTVVLQPVLNETDGDGA